MNHYRVVTVTGWPIHPGAGRARAGRQAGLSATVVDTLIGNEYGTFRCEDAPRWTGPLKARHRWALEQAKALAKTLESEQR